MHADSSVTWVGRVCKGKPRLTCPASENSACGKKEVSTRVAKPHHGPYQCGAWTKVGAKLTEQAQEIEDL